MSKLREKMLQAGLVSEEQAKRSEADEAAQRRARQERARAGKGRRGPDRGRGPDRSRGGPPKPAEERLTPEELAAAEAKRAQRERNALLERERQENRRRAAEERSRTEDVRRVADALGVEERGETVFHFTTRKKKLARMLLTQAQVTQLEQGELAIIEHPLPHAIEFAVVPREGAEAVLKIEPRAIRFYNRAPGESYGFEEGGG